jgi:hypothetical protein
MPNRKPRTRAAQSSGLSAEAHRAKAGPLSPGALQRRGFFVLEG